MIRTFVLGSLAAAATAATFAGLAGPTHAQTKVDPSGVQTKIVPTYTCEVLDTGVVARGFGNCEPSNGAVRKGRSQGPTLLMSRDGAKVRCSGGGLVHIPHVVEATRCQPA